MPIFILICYLQKIIIVKLMNTSETIQKVSPQQQEISKQEGNMIQQPIIAGVKEQSCSSSFKPLLSDIGDHQVSNHDHPSEQTKNFRINKSKSQNGSANQVSLNNQNCLQSQSLLGKSLQAHQLSNYRDCGITSRQQLISIPQTSIRESLVFRSAQTLILDDQSSQKREVDKANQTINYQSQQKKLRQQIPFNQVQQFTSNQSLKTNQDENLAGTKSMTQQNHQKESNQSQIFVQTHTVQFKLDQKKEDEPTKPENFTVSPSLKQEITPSKKFKIIKNVQVTIQPYKSHFTIIEMPKEQVKTQQSSKQLKIDVPPQPLKIQNLFISSLRSKSQIKPPQSTTQKKLKPWERKKKIESKPSQQVQNDSSIKTSQVPNTLNSINSNDSLIDSISHLQSLSSKNKEKPLSSIGGVEQANNEKITLSQQTKDKSLFTSKLNSKLFNQNDEQFLEKIKDNSESQKIPDISQNKNNAKVNNQSLKQTQDKPISFHFSSHHPLQKEAYLSENSNGLKTSNNLNQESKQLDEEKSMKQLKRVQEQPICQQKQQPQVQNPKEAQDPVQVKQQSDSCSSSSRNEIDINYNHNKQYQQQLHFLNRQRIKQLEQQLRNQQKINKQLENSIALPLKMAISTIAGASVAGLAWILKKNKVGSLVLGVATTMATFVISN